ncbi:hypothetical protein BCR35DRAFT_51856 [Leucosporidium creatinivorum]|uniref:Uncharacterized protein n=1 Tax=Leucosporidium creatinivorum TaxID=106004 RepID=A0A1Y2BT12_9BASI|nr:hypothetical protein BCR35DRAFT_51856 [Leucosporidium creatinivorum]
MEATPHLQQPTAHGKRSGAARRKLRKERQAQLDAQFANLEIDPKKGPKLPAELVYHIMCLSKPPPADFHSKQAQDHRRFLCRLSLVCSLWREEAQKLLWKLVFLRTEQHVEGFLSGGAKMHLTEELAIGGVEEGSDSPMNGELVNKVLARTADLFVLSVNKVVDFDPTALTRANFTSE